MKEFNIIVASTQQGGIGKNGQLPWSISQDVIRFKKITTHHDDSKKMNAVIMGRKTWESIPNRFRPLLGRINIVITRLSTETIIQNISKNELKKSPVIVTKTFNDALKITEQSEYINLIENIFVIGGQKVYEEAISHPNCERIYMTHVLNIFECDRHFPNFKDKYKLVKKTGTLQDKDYQLYFAEYVKRP